VPVKRFRAYIDESGDEGFLWYPDGSGSTKWFVIGAVVVEISHDQVVAESINNIKSKLGLPPNKPLHWASRRDHGQRKVIIQEIASKPLCCMFVGVYKPDITSSKLKTPPGLYLYATRYLLERVSWFVGDQGGRVDCIFEHRANLSYTQLRAYITSLIADPNTEIRDVIDAIQARNKDQVKNLQVIDACNGALYAALQPDRYGNNEVTYLAMLRDRLYRKNGKLFSYGLKLFPTDAAALSKRPGWEWLSEI